MRYYEITISPSDQTTVSFEPITFSSLNKDGSFNGSALGIDIDIFQASYNQPAQNGYIKIKGVDFRQIGQTAYLNFAKIKVSLGMSKGLPYAKEQQKGLVIDGTILQCFGNWIGTEVSLDLVIGPATYNPNATVNLTGTWTQGDTLEKVVRTMLSNAYKDKNNVSVPINGSFGANLKYTETRALSYPNLQAFSKQVYDFSKQIEKSPNYLGAQITSTATGFYLFDGVLSTQKDKRIEFEDIIGNLTWRDVATIQAKTTMRADLNLGDIISFPKGTPALNVVNNYSQYRNDLSFQGKFQITQLRHVGSSRQPDGNSWCTVIDAVIPGVPQ
jgi:hypothetical protein